MTYKVLKNAKDFQTVKNFIGWLCVEQSNLCLQCLLRISTDLADEFLGKNSHFNHDKAISGACKASEALGAETNLNFLLGV